jgi:diguanylate cyclase (GGDEF)-like protein
LFRAVCDASVHGSKFVATTVFLHESGERWLRGIASTGPGAELAIGVRTSFDESLPEGRGVIGEAFRTHRPCIGNDIMGDERFRPWWDRARAANARSVAALPLMRSLQCAGVLVYYSSEVGEFDAEMVALLERASANVSFALDRFAQEAERWRAETATRRASRMYAALSATNEAIMRVQSPRALFEAVCQAAVDGGGLRMATVLQPQAGSGWLEVVAVAGVHAGVEQLMQARISVDDGVPEGQGPAGVAFRSGQSQTCNDCVGDERMRPWHALARAGGIASNAAVPFRHQGRTAGLLLFFSHEVDAFDSGIVGLLERLSANVSFALEGFDREAERQNAQQRIQYLATHDALTGLPNRAMFGELLRLALHSARRYRRRFAVLFIDLDRFKTINDTLGHAAGDQLLQEIAARCKRVLRGSDVVARLGGDEFVVLMQEADTRAQVERVAQKLLDAAALPVMLAGREYGVSASIGIARSDDGDDEQSLMKNADIAMYAAKDGGKNNYRFHA